MQREGLAVCVTRPPTLVGAAAVPYLQVTPHDAKCPGTMIRPSFDDDVSVIKLVYRSIKACQNYYDGCVGLGRQQKKYLRIQEAGMKMLRSAAGWR